MGLTHTIPVSFRERRKGSKGAEVFCIVYQNAAGCFWIPWGLSAPWLGDCLFQVFGRPFHFFDTLIDWGALIACMLFGAMHLFANYHPLTGSGPITWWWGVSTAFGGLVFAYLREKTGGVLAPAIVHGLPQAIAALMLGFFAIR